jgi:isopenicillin N synthase-like dioxygenase
VLAPRAPRQSIALFVDPNPDAWVSAIASCVPPGETPRHAPILARDYLAQRLAATYGRAASAAM